MKILGIEYRPNPGTHTADIIDSTGTNTYSNPLVAWSIFIHKVDAAGRRRIGDQLEAQGYDRHTGELAVALSPAAPRPPSPPGARCDNCKHGQNGAATCPERFNKARCANGIPIGTEKED